MRGVELSGPIIDLTMAGGRATMRRRSRSCSRRTATRCSRRWVLGAVPSRGRGRTDSKSPGAEAVGAFFTPQAERSLALAAEAGIAAFRTPRRAPMRLRHSSPGARRASAQGEIDLGSLQGFELFSQLGVPVAPWAIGAAPEFRHSIPYPVAVKRLGEHKTESGGVRSGSKITEDLQKKPPRSTQSAC
jgi:hypothetical protein